MIGKAVCRAYPRVSPGIPNRAKYRNPDAIRGGTWEAFERIMKRRGYFRGGLRKVEAERAIAEYIDPSRSRSTSFVRFRDAIIENGGVNDLPSGDQDLVLISEPTIEAAALAWIHSLSWNPAMPG